MAIILKCSKCQEQLEVDDAFAGGICRCVHCGALSHVPTQVTRVDRKGRPLEPPPMARPAVAPVAAPGREEEQIVIAPTRHYIEAKKRRGLLALVMLLLAAVMIVAIILLLRALYPSHPPEDFTGEATTKQEFNPFRDKAGANYAGLAISGSKVAYLLDAAPADVFDPMTLAVEQSVRTLGGGQFAVICWPRAAVSFMGEAGEPGPIVAFPEQGLGAADSADARGGLSEFLVSEAPRGERRDPAGAVSAALERGADTIVLITTADLPADKAAALAALLAGKQATVLAALIVSSADAEAPELARLVGADKPDRLLKIRSDDLITWLRKAPPLEQTETPPADSSAE